MTLPTCGPSTSFAVDDKLLEDIQAHVTDNRNVAAKTAYMKKLEKMLDLNPFISHLEKLLATPIIIPDRAQVENSNNIFSVKNLYNDDEERRIEKSSLFNCEELKGREWLRDMLLEESDSEDDGDQEITQKDIEMALKIHRIRRKMQRKYHKNPRNRKYAYYGAGLLCETDPHPEHKINILRQFPRKRKNVEQTDQEISMQSTSGSHYNHLQRENEIICLPSSSIEPEVNRMVTKKCKTTEEQINAFFNND